MDKKKRLSSFLTRGLVVAIIYFIMFLIVFFSKELSAGIKNGINVSMNLVIPSMFIFMIFSNMIINSKLRDTISAPFGFLAKHIFRIEKSQIAIVILSLVGGYPVGAKLISNAVSQGTLEKKQAENMLCYCVNCGPAFLISGIGIAIYQNFRIGLYLYISQVAACLLIGFILSFFSKHEKTNKPVSEVKKTSYSQLFVGSVNDSVRSMAMICGFIVAFSAFMPIINELLGYLGFSYSHIVQGLLEVTTGCNSLAELPHVQGIILTTIFTAFGGICVHLQVYSLVGNGIKMTKFYIMRIIYTAISVFTMQGLLMLSPDVLTVISYNSNVKSDIYSVSPTATIFMILLAIMLLFFSKKQT